ncbi:MAG: 5-deoxy-glucuronate isomerase [Ilumatobacteraceae bacterium]
MHQIDRGHHRTRQRDGSTRISINPENAGWDFLSFAVIELLPGQSYSQQLDDEETAVVPLSGAGSVTADEVTFGLHRTSVFEMMPQVVYAPPCVSITVEVPADASGPFEFAIGSAPAVGKYPIRLIEPSEMKQELRGGGQAYRHVNHILAPPIAAERLILYEVYVPRGTWSGWAPHCHDGRDGSPYLEEVYYFRLDPADGFVLQRNWRDDEGFEEIFSARDGESVLVTKGYHSSVACPSSHMMFLNYLAGELYDDERTVPPCFDQAFTWIQDDWDHNAWSLPVVRPPQ